uniref:Hsp70-Hsp90 organising protein n=1 Tax=Globisporangium ultimum (strain ATCC 200006 / CBS 805.95 / DAOM BR144) TaxID=431595 RepID=K3X3Q4_GLOUD
MVNTAAEAKKNEGNEAFKHGKWELAVQKYTEAIEIDGANHVYYSNRSAAYAGWHKFKEAADDAAKCIEVNPDFVKGYHRHGVALKGLKKYEEALATLRLGQRKDFNNRDLNKLITEIEPLQERQEQIRRSGLNPAELLKEKGNDAFKTAAFEKAIEHYSEALEVCDDQSSTLALSCYNNRAACNQQLSNFSAVIRDCSHVLEFEPENQKALLRRALAYEGLERYRLALQDIRTLNSINPNIDIANKAQHRLGEYVRKLKENN